MADDWLHKKASERRSEPENGNLVGLRSEIFIDGAHVGHLEAPSELDPQKAETHIPDLPVAKAWLFHVTPFRALDVGGCVYLGTRSYVTAHSFRRARRSGEKASGCMRQRQFPPKVPGLFIRDSAPRPRMSCIGTIAARATEAVSARMSVQCISAPSVFR